MPKLCSSGSSSHMIVIAVIFSAFPILVCAQPLPSFEAQPLISPTSSLTDPLPPLPSLRKTHPKRPASNTAPKRIIQTPTDDSDTPRDDCLWLEDLTGEKPLAWVREQNAVTVRELESSPDFQKLRDGLVHIAASASDTLIISRIGGFYYHFLKNHEHVRGVLRRITPDAMRKSSSAWETVLDFDALAAAENENWTMQGISMCNPDDHTPQTDRMLIYLSKGGADARTVREFDLKTKNFVLPDAGGFVVPEAKSHVDWRDPDTLYVSMDFGPETLTHSNFPRILKKWKRDTPLSSAETLFEGPQTEAGVQAVYVDGHEFVIRYRTRTGGYHALGYVLQDGTWRKLDLPESVKFEYYDGQIILHPLQRWTVWDAKRRQIATYSPNSILAMDFDRFMAGDRDFVTLLEGENDKPVADCTRTKTHYLAYRMENLHVQIYAWRFSKADGKWNRIEVPVPEFGTTMIRSLGGIAFDDVMIATHDYINPPKLTLLILGQPHGEVLQQCPALFDSTGMEMHRYNAISKDGAAIPYFLVTPKNFRADSGTPVILHGYGGFGVARMPSYMPGLGKCWLERGGAYVFACVRGGGEFGAKWARGGARENRQNSFDDFAAVAQDLIARKITSPGRLGIMGGSNGGLLVSVAFMQHPELYHAVVCQSPVLDMRRFTKFFNGLGLVSEYGNPDIQKDWDYIKKYSPYQNIKPASEIKYPRVLFTAATNDDRVHPSHARKMVARMQEQGHDVLYYENTDGGHAGAANVSGRIYLDALLYTFFARELGLAK